MNDHAVRQTEGPARWTSTIGIIGGLGPFAHLDFERHLLEATPDARNDQDHPPWILSSMPGTPDRTAALLAGGPSPVPALRESLRRVAPVADFVVIPCNTAHVFIDALRGPELPPILSIVDESIRAALAQVGSTGRVGILATTGTLKTGLYPSRAAILAPGLAWISLLDLPNGSKAQERLTMRPIYGPPREGGGFVGGGIKAGHSADPVTGRPHRETLAEGVLLLRDAGAEVVVMACTEIPLALGRGRVAGVPLIDPLAVTARTAVAIASGRHSLP
ncbi:MAG: aspartate/glutamate racemase family protein [Myxococcales bacterium]|nr:aspartate/glutamate racemase family protein [Myxococcales bacterium]